MNCRKEKNDKHWPFIYFNQKKSFKWIESFLYEWFSCFFVRSDISLFYISKSDSSISIQTNYLEIIMVAIEWLWKRHFKMHYILNWTHWDNRHWMDRFMDCLRRTWIARISYRIFNPMNSEWNRFISINIIVRYTNTPNI